MERRDARRISRRLACRFQVDDCEYRGFVLNISREGLYLQTTVALDVGREMTLRLEGTRFPECELRAKVVRRLLVSGLLSDFVKRGVGLRLLDPPGVYLEALSQALQGLDHGEGQALSSADAHGESSHKIEIEVFLGEDDADIPTPRVEGSRAPPQRETSQVLGSTAVDLGPATLIPDAEPLKEQDLVLSEEEWDGLDPVLEGRTYRGPGGQEGSRSLTVDALVIDDGELCDVVDLLREIGADPVRISSRESSALSRLAIPPRVAVLSARSVIKGTLDRLFHDGKTATVVIAEGDSLQLLNRIRRQGFDHVVRRPVYPDALRLLLSRLVYRGAERRQLARVAIGGQVLLRAGLLSYAALLLEVSSGGCSLLSAQKLKRGSKVRLRIPREVTAGRSLSLKGRVVRLKGREEPSADWKWEVGIAFERGSSKVEKRLGALIQRYAVGPLPMQYANTKGEEKKELTDRRKHQRFVTRHEALSLDARERVGHVLLGRELSLSGMRIEAHPELNVGDVLSLLVYASWTQSSARVSARVVWEDPVGQTMGITFQQPSEEAVAALSEILSGPSFLVCTEVPEQGDQPVS